MFSSTAEWWTLLRSVAAINVVAWALVAWWLWRVRATWPPDTWLDRRWQLLLSAGYVLGCAWRSLLPVYDVQRLVMVDSFLSSVIVGRSVATVAEMCFAAQWALWMREVARASGHATAGAVSRALLPLIAVAEVFSWYSVLTTSNIGHVVEESIWGLSAAAMVVGMLLARHRLHAARRPLLALSCAAGGLYVAYMFCVDVPMYWSRWQSDEASGRVYLTVGQGLQDTAVHWVVSHRWDHWRSEVVWMTSYFSVCVWLSISMVLMPKLRPASA